MSSILADDIRLHYERAFSTIHGIIEAFPEDRWLEPHGDEYYIPSRIAYHLVGYIDFRIAGGSRDPDYKSKLPFGSWQDGTPETLPCKDSLMAYYDGVLEKAQSELAALDDDGLSAPIEPERARLGTSQIAAHISAMRELSAHTGELNKMLIENGKDDIWR